LQISDKHTYETTQLFEEAALTYKQQYQNANMVYEWSPIHQKHYVNTLHIQSVRQYLWSSRKNKAKIQYTHKCNQYQYKVQSTSAHPGKAA
jgi:hypothetical protein